jgi:hypothetical protein
LQVTAPSFDTFLTSLVFARVVLGLAQLVLDTLFLRLVLSQIWQLFEPIGS